MRGAELATKVLKQAALAAALCVGTYTAASATPLVFTSNPSATGDTTAGRFSADTFGITDWATIHVPSNPAPAGSVSEQGFLEFNGFTLGGVPVSTVHTRGAGGYGIFETFTATSHLSPCTGGFCGAFDSITVTTTLYRTVNGLATYTFNSAHNPVIHLPSGAHPVTLATGSGPLPSTIIPNKADITSGIPDAGVGVRFIPNAAESAFFISPAADIILSLEQAFTNTSGVITTVPSGCKASGALPCIFEIHHGGGNGDFLVTHVVPEPASLLLLGVGVGAIALTRRRHA